MGTKYRFSVECHCLEHSRFTINIWWRNESWCYTDSSCHWCCACIPSAHLGGHLQAFPAMGKVSWFSPPEGVFWLLGTLGQVLGRLDFARGLTLGSKLQPARDWSWTDAPDSMLGQFWGVFYKVPQGILSSNQFINTPFLNFPSFSVSVFYFLKATRKGILPTT